MGAEIAAEWAGLGTALGVAGGIVLKHFVPGMFARNGSTPLTEKNHALICSAKLAPLEEHMKTQVEAIHELKVMINRLIELR